MSADHLAALSDDELRKATITARDYLAQAAVDQHESQWHQACFAATVVYSREMHRRGLKIETVH